MRGIFTPPRPSASSGARGLARRQRAGDVRSEPLLNPAPEPGQPPAADGPVEPSNPGKLAEAHAMARRPEHPLHAALMNPIHPGHRHAVATYEALFRDAYAPARPGPNPAALPGVAGKPTGESWKRPLSEPAGGGTGSTLSSASNGGSAGQRPPKPDRAQPLVRLAQNEATSDADAGDGLTDAERIAADAKRGAEDQALHRWEQSHLLSPSQRIGGILPPPPTYITDLDTYREMREAVEAMPNLSSIDRNVFLRLLTYEGVGYDRRGGSRGGITQVGTWRKKVGKETVPWLQKIVEELRRIEGRDIPTPGDVNDFTITDIYDAMRAYALQEFLPIHAETIISAEELKALLEQHRGENPLAAVKSSDLAFQIFDVQFQYKPDTRSSIWEKALAAAIPEMYAALSASGASESAFRNLQRAVSGVRTAGADGTFAYLSAPPDRLRFAIAVGGSERLAPILTRSLQKARAEWMLENDPSEYRGANRARIWGITTKP